MQVTSKKMPIGAKLSTVEDCKFYATTEMNLL